MKRIGILGGTFDPPHIGHLLIAEEVRMALDLEEIWFIPSYKQPHKEQSLTLAKHRIQMVKRAIEGNSYFRINTIEVDRLGQSYTFDTMKALIKEYPTVHFFFIIGGDMVEYLPHWKNIEQLIDLVTFVGIKRYGYTLQTSYPIVEVDIPRIEISSTLIRSRLLAGQTVHYLIPDRVYIYIKEKRLYED